MVGIGSSGHRVIVKFNAYDFGFELAGQNTVAFAIRRKTAVR
jgi:hypothetical protein